MTHAERIAALEARIANMELAGKDYQAVVADCRRELAALKLPQIPEGFTPLDGREDVDGETIGSVVHKDGSIWHNVPAKHWSPQCIAYRITRPAPLKWPVWVPGQGKKYYYGTVEGWNWDRWGTASQSFEQANTEIANIFQDQKGADARRLLGRRLAIHAMLRQLGGGDEGGWTIRYLSTNKTWFCSQVGAFAAGEAHFYNRESAQAALDALKAAGQLVDGEAK